MHPEVLDTRPYADAKAAAEREKKWFLVKATAVWCGPCKQMDRTTMVDPKVVAWLKKNAIIVSLDVDKEPEIAKSLGIQAMPTMIAFRDGKEFDRIVGMRAAEPFLAWLEGIAEGKTSLEAIRKRAAAPGPGGGIDVNTRYEEAEALLQSQKFDEATTAYEWLWLHMLEHAPAMSGVRSSYMANNMKMLAAKHPVAKQRFTALRDAAAKEIAGEKVDSNALGDWIVLNQVIDDEDAILAWFDRVCRDPRWRELLKRHSFRYKAILVERGRLGDYGALIGNPVDEIRSGHEDAVMGLPLPADADPQMKASIAEAMARAWRIEAGTIYAAMLASGREADALAAATEAMKLDSSPALMEALVQKALKAKQPRKVQLEWIDAVLAAAKSEEAKSSAKPPNAAATEALNALLPLRSKVESALAQGAAPSATNVAPKSTP